MTNHATPRRPIRLVAVTIGLVAALLVTGCDPWGPMTSRYNGHTVVSGSGYTSIDSARVYDTLTIQDTLRDGNSVYGSARFAFWAPNPTDGYRWWETASGSTPEVENRKVTATRSTGLRTDSDRVRVTSYACAQMGWPVPDSCSDPAIHTYGY